MDKTARTPNGRLRSAREGYGWTLGQVAESIADHVERETGHRPPIDADHVSRFERGIHTWPNRHYRNAFRELFGVQTDGALGFYCRRSQGGAGPELSGEVGAVSPRPGVNAASGRLVSNAQMQRSVSAAPAASEANPKGPHDALSLVVVGGFAGSGKTELAKYFSGLMGSAMLDKDSLTRPLAESLLMSLGGDPNDRHTVQYRQHVRPLEYRCLINAAVDNLDCGVSTILAAPFLYEVTNDAWLRRVAGVCTARRARLTLVWVDADAESMRDYLAFRDAPRDEWKLSNWDRYVRSIDLDLRPHAPHTVIDNRADAPTALLSQAESLAIRVLQ